MKVQQSPKKKNRRRVRLDVHHSRASRATLADDRLRRIARAALRMAGRSGNFAVSVAFVGDAAMRRLNRAYARHDYVTDVLSFAALEVTGRFAQAPSRETFLGEIVVCWPQARRQAEAAQQPVAREIDWLLAHGVLHLLGYDHATAREERRMRALEAQVLGR